MRGSTIKVDPALVAASHQFLGPSSIRMRLKIYGPATGTATINTRPLASVNDGVVLGPQFPPLVIDAAEDGELVRQPFHVLYSAANLAVSWIETLD